MKPESEPHDLLDDVLAEAAPPDFAAELFDGTLCAVRRRRRWRRASRGVIAAGVLTAITLAVWKTLSPTSAVRVVHPALHIVSSQRLPALMTAESRPVGVSIVTSSPKTYFLVETGFIKDPLNEINDEQLLALTGERPVGLVRQGPHGAELIFLNPEDEHGFPVH